MSGAAPRVLILGGGIAGLAAAWECRCRGIAATVLEAQGRAGGVIRTDLESGFILDVGPDSFLATKPGAIDLIRELGIASQLISMSSPRGAYVLRDDRLHALPEGGAFGIATRPGPFLRSTLLSARGKLRVAVEPLLPKRRDACDESAGAFFRRRFGVEAAERIAQPLLGGIHVGDIDALSADAVFPQLTAVERSGHSVLMALRRQGRRATEGGPFRSFPRGMATLVDALLAALPQGSVRLDAAVAHIVRGEDRWHVQTASGHHATGDILVLAAPAATAAHWLTSVQPAAADLSGAISYVSSAGVLAAYPDARVARPLPGSGYVSVRQPGRDRLVATSWMSNKWAGRAPQGFTLLRGFFGGAFDQGVLASSDEELVALAHESWTRRFGLDGAPTLTRVVRWPNASPQHEVGHAARVARIDAALDALPYAAVCGSGFRAVGIPDVIADARRTVARLLDRWHAA
jgi:oxygen-dependent protoporphyrinogen oxidase